MGLIFPPKDVSQRKVSTMHSLNVQITMIHNKNGNATPGWRLHMYYSKEEDFT